MPGGNKNIKPEDGKQFSSDYQPPNRGRKPKYFSQLANEFAARGIEKATPERVKEAIEYLLALTIEEIITIAGTPKEENEYPALLRIIASELLGKKKREMILDILERAHGKNTNLVTPNGGTNVRVLIIETPDNPLLRGEDVTPELERKQNLLIQQRNDRHNG